MASFIAISIVILFTTLAFVGILPTLYHQTLKLIQIAPNGIRFFSEELLAFVKEKTVEYPFLSDLNLEELISKINLTSEIPKRIAYALNGIWTSTPSVLGHAVDIGLIPIFLFFILRDQKHFISLVGSIVPTDLKPVGKKFVQRCDRVIKSVLKGQLEVAGILGILYILGLFIVGVPMGWTVGLIAGICRIVPYLDVIIGLPLALLSCLTDFSGWGSLVGVFIVFGTVQALDGALITPKIIGQSSGLHPVLVICSVLAFGDWFGFYGVLLAIPIVALLKVVAESLMRLYSISSFYNFNKN